MELQPPLLAELVDVLNSTVTECSRVIGELDRRCKDLARNQKKLELDVANRYNALENVISQQNQRIEDLAFELRTLRESAANVGAVQTWVRETDIRNKAGMKKLQERFEQQLQEQQRHILGAIDNKFMAELTNIKSMISDLHRPPNHPQNHNLHHGVSAMSSEVGDFLDGGASVSSGGAASLTPSVNQALLEDLAHRCARLLENTRRAHATSRSIN